MQNRKDLLQAHRLMTQRAALAMICGDPDSPDQPLRRLNVGWVSGVLAGAVATGIFVLLGLLAPGHAAGLTQPGTLVVDKDTATPYVPCQDGKLCPALNYASALLALDTPNVNQVAVSQASLSRYPIGPTIGIAGLPPDLSTAADLVQGPRSVCEQAAPGRWGLPGRPRRLTSCWTARAGRRSPPGRWRPCSATSCPASRRCCPPRSSTWCRPAPLWIPP